MDTPEFSRRSLLQTLATGTATVLTVAALSAGADGAAAQAKASKKVVEYQEQPKGNQSCQVCANFIAPSSCKVVEGDVVSQGWCRAFSPKPT
jgi:hypothetical protein